MKVGKQYIGKVVEVQWADPNYLRRELHEVKRGRLALATWREYGIVYDVSDGVVMILHSFSYESGRPMLLSDGPETAMKGLDELARTAVQEDLIEKITVFEPVKEGA